VSSGPARLAQAHGVLLSYRDSRGRLCVSPEPAVRAVLEALGVETGPRAAAVAAQRRGWQLPSVIVAWDGRMPDLAPFFLSGDTPRGRKARLTLLLETGEEIPWEGIAGDGRASRVPKEQARRLLRLPWGRHLLRVETLGESARRTPAAEEVFVISAPRRCWSPEEEPGAWARGESELSLSGTREGAAAGPRGEFAGRPWDSLAGRPWDSLAGRPWGMFCPTYALRSARDWGAGDLADLEALCTWVGRQGGSVVATLPLLAPFPSLLALGGSPDLAGLFDPSPYRPSSRLFWNEFYLAVDRLPEWDRCAAARHLWASSALQAEWQRVRSLPLVDYLAVAELKKRVLELLAACFFAEAPSEELRSFADYVRENPLAREFALFQAASVQGSGLGGRARGGPETGDKRVDEGVVDFHLYCQWRMGQQLAELAQGPGAALLLDLPLGVHPAGFDATKWPRLFVPGVSCGAPPDDFFAEGQVWDFPPLHPERDRQNGYRYLSACLAAQMRYARYLRVDHVMSFHRLFWVPQGMSAKDGVYVTYPAEEMYAVLSLESHRHQTRVVGEDLGTVPAGVRSSMRRHGVGRTWVFQSSVHLLRAAGRPPREVQGQSAEEPPQARVRLDPVPSGAVASLNTHDMVPFASFLRGDDIARCERGGGVRGAAARRALAARRRLVSALLRHFEVPGAGEGPAVIDDLFLPLLVRVLHWLARTPARLVLVNLEDLWGETEPQNVPGTGPERPNWARKVGRTLEDLVSWSDTDGTERRS